MYFDSDIWYLVQYSSFQLFSQGGVGGFVVARTPSVLFAVGANINLDNVTHILDYITLLSMDIYVLMNLKK
jgi:hypothetical protein